MPDIEKGGERERERERAKKKLVSPPLLVGFRSRDLLSTVLSHRGVEEGGEEKKGKQRAT